MPCPCWSGETASVWRYQAFIWIVLCSFPKAARYWLSYRGLNFQRGKCKLQKFNINYIPLGFSISSTHPEVFYIARHNRSPALCFASVIISNENYRRTFIYTLETNGQIETIHIRLRHFHYHHRHSIIGHVSLLRKALLANTPQTYLDYHIQRMISDIYLTHAGTVSQNLPKCL